MSHRDLTDTLAQHFAGGAHLPKAAECALPESERRGVHLAAGQAAHLRRATAETDRFVVAAQFRSTVIPNRRPLIDRETRIALVCCSIAALALILVCCDVPYQLGRLWGSL